MTNGDKATFLAVELVLNCKALATAITAVGEGLRVPAIVEGHVVVTLGFQELGASKAVWDGGETCSSDAQVLHPLPDFGGGPGCQGSLEGLVNLLSSYKVRGTSSVDAVLVVFEAKGCVVKKGVD